jgi:hypothetical protein
MGSTTEYDNIYSKSLFTELNMSSRYSPATLSSNMIPCNSLSQFHYETSLYLNIITALYIELKNKEINAFDYNINKFNDCITKLNIIIDNSTNTTSSPKLSDFTQDGVFPNATKYDFTFYVKTFESYINNPSSLYTTSIYNINEDILTNCKPNFGSYPIIALSANTNINNINNVVFSGISSTNKSYNKSNISRSTIVNPKLKEILRDILNQTPQNIMGYLLYQKIKYNITLYNIEIQNSIRRNYINNQIITDDSDVNGKININKFGSINNYITPTFTNLVNIKDKIQDCIDNINILNNNTFPTNNYLVDKNVYTQKINVFNNLREEYETILDKLNMSIKLYNIQINNYNKIKGYATIVIIILIMIVVFIISLSVLPIFNSKTKNSIYIITLIILLIITYIYYNTFKFVNLYEQFVTNSDFQTNQTILTCSVDNPVFPYRSTINNHRINHATFYNNLNSIIVNYNDAVANIFNNLRMNVYTIGSQSFTKDSDVLLYKLYLEKKRQLEVNRIKLTNLVNVIEIIKKQTNYLFNIILIIAMLTMVLLIGLLLFSTVPQLIYPIIILCVILIVVIMIYFAFTIIQPTRMVANKNYWSITNPTSKTTGKI